MLCFVTNRKADNIIWGMVSNCIIWWRTKINSGCIGTTLWIAWFFLCSQKLKFHHHITQFESTPFNFGLLYKQWQTSDVLISVLYFTSKPKWIEVVLPIIILHNIRRFQVLKGLKIASMVQKLQPFFWIWLYGGFHVLYKIYNFHYLTNINCSKF